MMLEQLAKKLYEKYFMRYETGRFEFTMPFKKMWFAIPRYIHHKNWEGVEYLIQPDGTRSKPKPFWGMVFEKTEGEATPYAWWKLIRFVKKI